MVSRLRAVITILFLCLGCSSQSEREQPRMSRKAMPNDQEQLKVKDVSSQSIRGSVSRIGVSRGKTIAAWNGVPPPHPFLVVTLDLEERQRSQSGDEVYVWFPHNPPESMEALLGKHIELFGRWVHPPKREPADIHQPMQQPIEHVRIIDIQEPIALEIDDDLLEGVEPSSASTSHTPSIPTPKVKEDKVWIPIDREAHFQASKVTLLN